MKAKHLGIILAAVAALALIGIIFCDAKHHFFTFLTLGGLAYALLTEKDEDAEKENQSIK